MVERAEKIAVIGAGAWGTTVAALLATKGYTVRLWAYEAEVVSAIQAKRENELFLRGVRLPDTVIATQMLDEAVRETSTVVFAVPSHAARSVLERVAPLLAPSVVLVSITKGIEEGSLKLMSEVCEDVLGSQIRNRLAVLSGPSFAAEVCTNQPTAVTIAGCHPEVVKLLQGVFLTGTFRVYAATDVVGVQLGGALKNVMAVAAGVVDGLQLGHNTRAALITRGLAEMIRLGRAMGADPLTFSGLSGLGDLVLTCTSPLSRNYTVGQRLGRGDRLASILAETRTVAEGVHTSRAALGLAQRYGVEMPIVREVCAVLFDGKSPQRAVAALMDRTAKDELAGVFPG